MKFNVSFVGLINTEIKVKVLRYFMQHEAPMSEREIASVLKVSHMSVNRTLKELASYNIVNFVTVGKAHLWKINKKSYVFEVLSTVIKSMFLLETSLENLKYNIRASIPKKLARKAVLFGSIAHSSESADSDIDLFLLVKDDKDKKTLMGFVDNLSNKCLELYGNRLSAYVLTEIGLKEKKNSAILQEIDKGIIILP